MTHILHQIDHAIELLDDAYPSVDRSIRETLERVQVEITRLGETNEKIKRSAVSAGCCPTCLVQAPEPYGCPDCLNTGWAMGGPPGFVRDKTYNDAKAEITRLRALTAPQPIETAPRDGTAILVEGYDAGDNFGWRQSYWALGGYWAWTIDAKRWLPLPEDPK